jgi:TfoX/Sxy family transcriptional regulator of competence genes
VQIPKPSPADVDRFRSIVPDDPRVEVKPMFGNLGAFVNGNMFMGLFGADIGVKLAPADADALRAQGAGPFGPAERPMGGYVTLPPAIIGSEAGRRWVSSALDHVASMPPKAPKASRR